MTIDAVDRGDVRGTIFIVVAAPDRGYYNREVPFSGGFEHGELTIWLPPRLSLSLKVAGRTMQGNDAGAVHVRHGRARQARVVKATRYIGCEDAIRR